MKRYLVPALLGLAALAAAPIAGAQVSINLGIGGYAPPPVVYEPARPVYRVPPPVVYRGHGDWGHEHHVVVVHHDDHHHDDHHHH